MDSEGDMIIISKEMSENLLGKRRHANVNQSRSVNRKSCFAAVVPDNIKLVYLKRSLVQEFLKVPESFDSKIVGSFVRMRSDPFDIYQKNPFQLQLVTGVEKVSEASTEVCLKVANYFQDIPISKLLDGDFTDEEIEDVRDRIKAGALQRLTVVELKAKVQMLHADITKHEIARELILLKRRIERANEKGWRRELYQYLDRRKLLQTPSEVEKLLHKIPKVIAEEVEPDISASENVEGNGCSLTPLLGSTSDVSNTDASGAVADDLPTPRRGNVEMESGVILGANPCAGNLNAAKHVKSGPVTGNSSKHVTKSALKMKRKYNSDDDTSTEVEILDTDQIIKGGISSAFVPSKIYINDLDISVESSDFRDRVLKILKKPFDNEEYRRLSGNANLYLATYPDLKMKLDEYRYDKLTRMTILRGFSFWLQNVVHDKAFKPWEDSQCLAVLPGSGHEN